MSLEDRVAPRGPLPLEELICWRSRPLALEPKQIAEGVALVEKALRSRRFGAYTLQAAIAAVHGGDESVVATDWRQIVVITTSWCDLASAVFDLNRAVAIGLRDGPEADPRI